MTGRSLFYDVRLERHAKFLTETTDGMERIQRWTKYVAQGARPENDLQHTFSATLLAVIMIETLRQETDHVPVFDAYSVLAGVVLHDLGETVVGDTHYIDKSDDIDQREIDAFTAMTECFGGRLRTTLIELFTSQFATRQSDTAALCSAEALVFDAIERYGYLLYAYREYHQNGQLPLLVQVLRNQQARLSELAVLLPTFGVAFYTPKLDAAVTRFLKTHRGRFPETPAEPQPDGGESPMKISRYETIPNKGLLARIATTRLRGYGGYPIYENAQLELVEGMDPRELVPAQRYVLESDFNNIEALYESFLTVDVNIFALRGGLLFWTEDSGDDPIPLIPPIIEESLEPNGKQVLLINDGMHRVYTAMRLGQPINVIVARGVPTEYPYYAYALEGGWGDVEELEELPDNYVKKAYRDPGNYKSLFRDFNAILPGVQKQRKKSNPTHLNA